MARHDEFWSWLVDRHRSQWLPWLVKLGIFLGSSLGGRAPPRPKAEHFRWVKYHHLPRFPAAPKKMERDGKGWTNHGGKRPKKHPGNTFRHLFGASFCHGNADLGQQVETKAKRTTSPMGVVGPGVVFCSLTYPWISELSGRIAEAWTTGALGMAPKASQSTCFSRKCHEILMVIFMVINGGD